MFKLSGLFLAFATCFSGIAQIGEPINEGDQKTATMAPQCRELMMVQDCNGYVYTEYVNIEGRDQEIIFHRKSGKPFTGDCKVCYNNGLLKMHVNYVNGRLVGQDTVYYENGKINLITSHDPDGLGKEDGTWKYYREDGSLKWEKKYEMGLKQGEHRFYFADSTLYKIEVYKDNQLHGKKQEFYPDQTIKKEIEYKNGKWNGKYITYSKEGKVVSEQEYVNGIKDGPSAYYYDDGTLFYTENHDMGKRQGTFKRFYANGKMWTVENYDKDRRHGEFEEYYDNEKNTIKYKATYKKGERTYEMYYDEFGGEVMSPEQIEALKKEQEIKDEDTGGQSEEEKEENEGGRKWPWRRD